MDYKQKYLKYKSKYIELKEQIGGLDLPCFTDQCKKEKIIKEMLQNKKDILNKKFPKITIILNNYIIQINNLIKAYNISPKFIIKIVESINSESIIRESTPILFNNFQIAADKINNYIKEINPNFDYSVNFLDGNKENITPFNLV